MRVVNFVAQGTIEEGMLAVLKFKKSLFAGVLDGGEKEVFLGGSRLNKFMETVESATKAIPVGASVDTNGESPTSRERKRPEGVRAAGGDPMTNLVQTGLAFLQNLAAVAKNGGGATNPLVTRDDKTGEQYLKLPMPSPDVMQQLMTALSALVPK